jgi:hydrogenase-4 membrane subunit HyfE
VRFPGKKHSEMFVRLSTRPSKIVVWNIKVRLLRALLVPILSIRLQRKHPTFINASRMFVLCVKCQPGLIGFVVDTFVVEIFEMEIVGKKGG